MRTLALALFLAGCGPLDEPFDAGQDPPRRDAGSPAKTPLQLCGEQCPVWGVLETFQGGSVCHCSAETPQQTMARCSSECPGASSVTVTYASQGALGVCVCHP